MAKKKISREKIINAFLFSSFDKSAGATSLQDISNFLEIKKASLYNHFSSKDEMYEATLDYCKEYLSSVNFIPDEINLIKSVEKDSLNAILTKIIKRYLKLYEAEPLFQIYTFIHTEQYFNLKAAEISANEIAKIKDGIFDIFKIYSDYKKIKQLTEPQLENISQWFSSALINQFDIYITNKKEIVRQNPEAGAGSLFALPTDDSALDSIISITEEYISNFTNN